MKTITIKDIAKECGVGVSTVSRAINNHPDISDETKEDSSNKNEDTTQNEDNSQDVEDSEERDILESSDENTQVSQEQKEDSKNTEYIKCSDLVIIFGYKEE